MNPLLVVLDLDETLIHATTRKDIGQHDFELEGWNVFKRPFLDEFLDFCFDEFDVAVWTSAGGLFAEGIVRNIMDGRTLQFLWSAERCTRRLNHDSYEYYDRKHLTKIVRQGWERDRIVSIDDTPSKWEASFGNYIQVEPFYGDSADRELPALQEYLGTLQNEASVRSIDKRSWRLNTHKSKDA